MIAWLLLLLPPPVLVAEAKEQGRTYALTTVEHIAAGKWPRPRATVVGTVAFVKKEADGDIHIRLVGDTPKGVGLYAQRAPLIVCEIIPELPAANGPPKVGDRINVWGIVRHDGEHNWYEIHPVIGWEIAK